METNRVQGISKALSDDLRVAIVEMLAYGKPRRYSEIMSELGLDNIADSSKFAYHMSVLTESGIVEKSNDKYRISSGGREVIQGLKKITDGWTRYGYEAALSRLTREDLSKLVWARLIIQICPYWILNPLLMLISSDQVLYPEYILMYVALGVLFLISAFYFIVHQRGTFNNDAWMTYFSVEASRDLLGEVGKKLDWLLMLPLLLL